MKRKNNGMKNGLYYVLIVLAIVMIVYFFFGNNNQQSSDIEYSTFNKQLADGKIKSITVQPTNGVYRITGQYKKKQEVKETSGLSLLGSTEVATKRFTTIILPSDTTLSRVEDSAKNHGVNLEVKEQSTSGAWVSLLASFVPFLILFFFFYMMMGQQGGGGNGGRVMNFGKSKAKEADKKANRIRFSDVAGAEEEKQELVEVVEFLKDPRRFIELGARIPAGVLLEGPPGTGKTLLAKAVAGEAGVPFYSISGSDFVEMFVGVGASRVRDLFETAKKNAPAIIFIDEIDAVGRQRGAGMGGGHDEREQTLNQLLVEMDGFDGNEGVIVIAATNRSDVLDPALLRPGRFDRQILVGRPDVKGREAILHVHARNKPFADDINLKVVAQQTPGFVGADLENVLNEAALVAARRNKKKIDASDIDEAEDRVIAGPAKKDKVINKKEREMVAFHEAGHTIVGLVLSRARVVHKVTIIPRGRAGGYMIALPKEDQNLMTREDLFEQVVGLLGGRTAEEIIFGVQTTGASNDFEQATALARSMVTEYGMSDRLGPVQYEGNHQVFVGRDYGQTKAYSEQVAFEIDEEVRRILQEGHQKAYEIIQAHREQHKLIAEKLLEYETLDARSIKSLFEKGVMPQDVVENQFPSEKTQTFEEAKRALEEKDAQRQTEEKTDFDEAKKELSDEAKEVRIQSNQTEQQVQSDEDHEKKHDHDNDEEK
ncbi:ATP-dependent zinc metalloprotease FtsH [Melissococcus plutonius]|uniref:ATP-dependent zinc metalloprotease FtsH n=1 Tax=Melissococcus plutonius (strain ATCC 35311 / DSM 29964 / CIP 104052 / LMG 20360 / NCIMB 702443) TaxID=940190 RepID=F3Y8E1_MELPT|nr:ATP-dependent zinc metalloprotease FtsH [Melissococcus plutonius]KMT25898.1 ATP-dependent zinc metalloprotease FtsH [Melissococcus plutonius]KMT27243.1 ATP-dependent zinc metalloprotease FtsH [Melissococcus plutonius]KMT28344.1 ATP-dependent zinc metalloprotease FtsH [Melissococcus plutonius]KMT30080.1 ATP-dependent zinc metalloprotease FtsH [Melissococcus plutonius]KMT30744.1 ATP-dependent zinc metalloprotease FtsH [Melissococcus plutonius]